MSDSSDATVVDFWFDPVCPYSWTASRWLREVQQCRPVRVRYHVMSLYLLNEHRTDVAPAYRRNVEASRGPARVATAAATTFGEGVLEEMDCDEHDEAMRRSHDTGLALAGGEVGTPITSVDGVGFYGPVLNAIPRGEDADRVFDGARLLAGYPQFFELKRTRVRPPVFT